MKKLADNIPKFFMLLALLMTGCAKEPETTAGSDARSAFLGDWNVSETWTKQQNYTVTIYADQNSTNGVFITDFANLKSLVPAGAVISGNTITLDANQVIEDHTINGSGTLSGTKITWKYTLFNGATLTHADATYTKQ